MHAKLHQDICQFDIRLWIFVIDTYGFLVYLNSIFIKILIHFSFGPVQVNIVKIGKFLQTFNNVAFNYLQFIVWVGLHQGGYQPKIQFFLFILVLDVWNDLFEVNTSLWIFLIFQELFYFLILCDYHMLFHINGLVLFALNMVRWRIAAWMLKKFTFAP